MRRVASLALAALCLAHAAGAGETTSKRPEGSDAQEGVVRLEFRLSDEPIAVRLELTDQQGRSVLTPVVRDRFVADGEATLRLPVGRYHLTVLAGPRRTVWKSYLDVEPGEIERTVRIEPFFPLERRGWWLCDPFVDAHGPGQTSPSLSALLLASRACGLSAVGVTRLSECADEMGEPFDGPRGAVRLAQALAESADQGCVVLDVSRGAAGGRAYRLHPAPVLQEGDRGAPRAQAFPARLVDWHARAGLTVWSFGAVPEPDQGRRWSLSAARFVYATLAGPLYDVLDLSGGAFPEQVWRFQVDRGHHIPTVGGGSGQPPADLPAPGCYLPAPERLEAKALLDRLRDGNVTVSNGPFVAITIDGAPPGATLAPSDEERVLSAIAFASSAHDDAIDHLEVVYNGEAVRTFRYEQTSDAGVRRLYAEQPMRFARPGWVVVRYVSTAPERHRATTGPIYFAAPQARAPLPPVTEVAVRATRRGAPVGCVAEVYNRGAMVGRQVVGPEGAELSLPCTASVLILDDAGRTIKRVHMYAASGADAFTRALAEQSVAAVQQALLDPATYARMREVLARGAITVELAPGAER